MSVTILIEEVVLARITSPRFFCFTSFGRPEGPGEEEKGLLSWLTQIGMFEEEVKYSNINFFCVPEKNDLFVPVS